FSLTGYLPLRNAIRKELRRSLGLSLLLTSILVALAMWVALRDTGLAVLSILPNVIPIVFSFGLLGWSGVPIDLGSMMTASIALGIAVDDTFHMLVAYQRQKTSGDDVVDRALKQTYFPILSTSLICGAGMLVFLACDFIAAARFGGLLATMLMAALFGDLVLLPALLMIAGNRPKVEDQHE
ncbi:MAG: MMPL family transporter, partial [Planctomycetaceae bacterium]|nr:MMPL family transporter [Planctomycetaceae bacterium]